MFIEMVSTAAQKSSGFTILRIPLCLIRGYRSGFLGIAIVLVLGFTGSKHKVPPLASKYISTKIVISSAGLGVFSL